MWYKLVFFCLVAGALCSSDEQEGYRRTTAAAAATRKQYWKTARFGEEHANYRRGQQTSPMHLADSNEFDTSGDLQDVLKVEKVYHNTNPEASSNAKVVKNLSGPRRQDNTKLNYNSQEDFANQIYKDD